MQVSAVCSFLNRLGDPPVPTTLPLFNSDVKQEKMGFVLASTEQKVEGFFVDNGRWESVAQRERKARSSAFFVNGWRQFLGNSHYGR
jgi:hypothetical protein